MEHSVAGASSKLVVCIRSLLVAENCVAFAGFAQVFGASSQARPQSAGVVPLFALFNVAYTASTGLWNRGGRKRHRKHTY